MTNDEIFIKYISEIESFLNKFGYYIHEEEGRKIIQETSQLDESLSCSFVNRFVKQTIYLSCRYWVDGGFSLNLRMYKIPSEHTSFSLVRFLKKHKLESKISIALPAGGGEFEPFVKKYFEDLAVLFENELNDQITGKKFENHWQEEMDEFNDRYR